MKTKFLALVLGTLLTIPCVLRAEEVEIQLMEVIGMGTIPGDDPLDDPEQSPGDPPRPTNFHATINGNSLSVTNQSNSIPTAQAIVVNASNGGVVLNQQFSTSVSHQIANTGVYVLLIETAGGGVEEGEDIDTAIRRELKEELGIEVEVLCKIGLVSDYYNLIHRHNINNYFLCKITAFGEKHLTKDEIEDFHLSTLKVKYEEALAEYDKCSCTSLGRLVANREVPVLKRAKELLSQRECN